MGPLRADLLKKELNIFTFGDLLEHYPFRHIDRTKLNLVNELTPLSEYAQVAGVLVSFDIIGQKAGKRLVAQLKDKTGILELTWFQGINWVQKLLEPGKSYLVYGRVGFFNGNPGTRWPPDREAYSVTDDAGEGERCGRKPAR